MLTAVLTAEAQMQDPIHFRSELKRISDTEAELLFQATIDAGWHVYSTGLGNNGPMHGGCPDRRHTESPRQGGKAV